MHTTRPMEAVLNLPGLNKLRNLPLLRAVFTPPVAVENVAVVAATAAGLSLFHFTFCPL